MSSSIDAEVRGTRGDTHTDRSLDRFQGQCHRDNVAQQETVSANRRCTIRSCEAACNIAISTGSISLGTFDLAVASHRFNLQSVKADTNTLRHTCSGLTRSS